MATRSPAHRAGMTEVFDVVLFQPEIPPNTGNVIRLCANTGARLHLVEPLGFSMDEKQLRRTGLGYQKLARVTVHRDWDACEKHFPGRRLLAFSTRDTVRYAQLRYEPRDV